MNFKQFIKLLNLRNSWIVEEGLSIYVRRSIYPTHDYELASLNADSPRGGSLTKFLNEYEKEYAFLVENCLNKRLEKFLLKRGYIVYDKRSSSELGINSLICTKNGMKK
jgi:hypothetical protein